ncbi:MAG: CHRD domain-containing protein [Nitrospirota bacterium]
MKRHYGKLMILIIAVITNGIVMNSSVAAADYSKAPVLVGYLSGDQITPNTGAGAKGKVEFRLSDDGSELYYKLSVATDEKVTAAYIYLSPDGENGRAVVSLFDLREYPQRGSFISGVSEGIITADKLIGPLVGNPVSSLLREMGDGKTYVTVLTEKYPGGYIRGRVVNPLSFGN